MYPIAKSIAYFAMRHGVPEFGWEAAVERIQQFYSNEFKWKIETVSSNNLTHLQFERLMDQTRRGIMDGIDAFFETPAAGETAQADGPARTVGPARLAKHAHPAPVVLRRMNAPEDVLRICMMSQDHGFEKLGGIGRWSNLVARGLAERGHEVTLLGHLGQTRPREYCDFTKDGYWSHRIGNFDREVGRERDCLGLPPSLANTSGRLLSEIERIMPRRQFQVASSPIWEVEGAALIGAGTIPTVLSLHTCVGLILPSKPEWRADETYYKNHVLRVMNAEIQALRRCPMILANSDAIMKDISAVYDLDLFARPHAVIPHGIDDIDAPEGVLEARIAAREAGSPANKGHTSSRWGQKRITEKGPLRLLFLGRLETRKGIADLVPVLERLLARGDNVMVDLVGDGVDEISFQLVADLLEKYPGNVVWHGFLDDADLDVLMRQTDIFIAPSLYESFGLIYIEAMRYAIPSVAYATGGVPEVVRDGVDGLLAPLGDQAKLYEALIRLVDDADLRGRMSRAARTSFETRFHYRLMAERLEKVYRDAIGQPQPS